MYQRGDLITITEKANLSNYMFAMIVNVYKEGLWVISLDPGSFKSDRFKKYKKLGIKHGKYIRFNKYNIYINGHAQEYYSEDRTIRTFDRPMKHLKYVINAKYYEYISEYKTFDNETKVFAYVYIEKFTPERREFSGGLVISNCTPNLRIKPDSLLNTARARAEVNMYKQFSREKDN